MSELIYKCRTCGSQYHLTPVPFGGDGIEWYWKTYEENSCCGSYHESDIETLNEKAEAQEVHP